MGKTSLEIKIIMELLAKSITKYKKLIENNVKLNVIGDLNDLPDKV